MMAPLRARSIQTQSTIAESRVRIQKNIMHMQTRLPLIISMLGSFALAACGGGGGGSTSNAQAAAPASSASAPAVASAPVAASVPGGASIPAVTGEALPSLSAPQAGST